jgi:lipopolysaccharide assembly protein A
MTTPPAADTPPERQRPASSADSLSQPANIKPLRIQRTRASTAWVAGALFAVVLLFLLIFILQNGHTVAISFFGTSGHLPLGVALLLAAVLGVLLVAIPGTTRILQLRITARRHRRLDAAAVTSQVPRASGDADITQMQ